MRRTFLNLTIALALVVSVAWCQGNLGGLTGRIADSTGGGADCHDPGRRLRRPAEAGNDPANRARSRIRVLLTGPACVGQPGVIAADLDHAVGRGSGAHCRRGDETGRARFPDEAL